MPTDTLSARERFARHAPPLILLLVALSQVWLAGFGDALLTPAKGGGFGLFSTVDKLANRELLVTVIEASGREWIWRAGSRHRVRVFGRARSLPTQANLRAVASYAATQMKTRPGMVLRVEVWKKVFVPETAEVRRSAVARTLFEIDAAAS